MTTTVLCVDGDDAAREATASALAERLDSTWEIAAEPTLADARERLAGGPVDCLVTEYDLPDGSGLELLADARDRWPDTGCILYTDADWRSIETDRFEDVIAEFVEKGGDPSVNRLAELVRVTATDRVQTAYPLPGDEDGRLAALDRYDFDAERLAPALERVTDLATAHYGVPLASIHVIAEHEQHAYACRDERLSMPRDDSVCTYAIVDDQVTVIEDLRDDPRFAGNEVLRKIDIRFYASAPLTLEGHTVGTLCVFDEEPREFTEADRSYLRTLAALACDLMEYQRAVDEGSDAEGRERVDADDRVGDAEG